MKFPTIISGTAKDSDLSVMVGGVEKKGYDAYVIVDGAAKLFYKRAIEWTTEITEHHTFALISYGNSDTQSAFISGEFLSVGDGDGTCYVVYNFSETLNLKAGQTINIHVGRGGSFAAVSATFDNDSSPFYYVNVGVDAPYDDTYTLPADRAVSSITAMASMLIRSDGPPYAPPQTIDINVTINSDYGSFLLNNSGTSNQ